MQKDTILIPFFNSLPLALQQDQIFKRPVDSSISGLCLFLAIFLCCIVLLQTHSFYYSSFSMPRSILLQHVLSCAFSTQCSLFHHANFHSSLKFPYRLSFSKESLLNSSLQLVSLLAITHVPHSSQICLLVLIIGTCNVYDYLIYNS